MTAFCAGKNVHIILNGKVVVDANLDDWKNPLVNPDGTPVPPWHRGFPALSTIPTYGRVGFQGVHGEAGVRIRNLRIASLGKTTANNELKLACQLWTVKDLWSKKPDKIAAFSQIFPKLKAMGYDGVQSMAFIREDPSALEKILKENNLVIADQPVGLHDIEDEAALQKTIAFCKRFGVDFIYVPWFSAKTAEQWRSFCKRLNTVEVKLKAHGIKVGYHNHIHELTEKVDGEYPWDILTGADGTRLEMDIGPVLEASKTPADEIMKMGSRIPGGIHAKAVGATAAGAIGEKHEWPKIVAAAKKAGVKWLVVECEKRQDIFDDAEASAKYLRPLVNLANEIK
jgi:sugar phosphate isomerase/epimerase